MWGMNYMQNQVTRRWFNTPYPFKELGRLKIIDKPLTEGGFWKKKEMPEIKVEKEPEK